MKEPPETLDVTAVLDPSPRYAGTSHDDATARAMGYRAALVPGAFVYGHVTRMAVQGWGEDWLARGHARVRFRRPVHNGDALRVARGPLARDDAGWSAAVTVTQRDTGAVVLDGGFGLADRPPAPPAALPRRPRFDPPMELVPGGIAPGLELGSAETVLSRALVEQSLADFHETLPIYAGRGLIHSGCLLRKTMGDALGNLILPMPVILAGAEVRNLAPAPMDESYATSARVTRAWESKGKHFFESEEWLFAGSGTVVARHVRQNLYAVTGG